MIRLLAAAVAALPAAAPAIVGTVDLDLPLLRYRVTEAMADAPDAPARNPGDFFGGLYPQATTR